MKNILAIDSSTEACSVVVSSATGIAGDFQISPRKHAELLLPMVDAALSASKLELKQIDAIACCVGPGAFTGLRIAISMAQALGYAANLPCVAISSLQVLAAQAMQGNDAPICLASIDARMNEVYFGAFARDSAGLPVAISQEQVISPLQIETNAAFLQQAQLGQRETNEIVLAGSGWQAYEYGDSFKKIKQIGAKNEFPDAKYMISLAESAIAQNEIINASKLRPSYLRNNVAKKKSAQN